ncbi:MAG: DUF4430 domain-containing protein [Oscillospiraceae bacterium]|nr:DUF4430 domain-containing protein [Candidatus Limimonas coprohippi]
MNKNKILNALMIFLVLALAVGATIGVTSIKKSQKGASLSETVTLSTTKPTTKAAKSGDVVLKDGKVISEESSDDITASKSDKITASKSDEITASKSDEITERTSVKTVNEKETKKTSKKVSTTKKTNTTTKSSKPTTTKSSKPTTTATEDVELKCTIEIRCDTILNNRQNLTPGKEAYVPSNGIILPRTTVYFEEGDTAFDVLKNVCDAYGIQIEYSYTPGYDSYYVEGINHLYEGNCGSQSGWMYKVNGWFPNYGCSSFKMESGDNMVWCYTCKGLGEDVGCYMN